MNRLILIALLATLAFDAQASTDTCGINGTAYDYSGRPLTAAVIRLSDRQTSRIARPMQKLHSRSMACPPTPAGSATDSMF